MDKRYHYITPEDYETAERNGINKKALEQRVRDHEWDIDRAVTQPLKKEVPFKPVWEKWRSVAYQNGIGRDLFYQRIKMQGLSEVEAATKPIRRGGSASNRWTPEDRAIIEANGITIDIARSRINLLGWSKEDAISTPKITEAERVKRVGKATRAYHERRKKDESREIS